MKKKQRVVIAGLVAMVMGGSCVPDIYLVDRQTVLEVEASGDWPELDEEVFQLNKRMGPVGFKTDKNKKERANLSKITDGDYGAKDAAKAQ